MFDFAVLPPEINSGRMYSGPGSSSLQQAGASWSRLAAEMRSATVAYRSVISGLTGGDWLGPSSESMAGAASAYAEWMDTTAAQVEQTASAAKAAAKAYESAYAVTVSPAAVAANRARLLSLVSTNILGHNTAAIAATEAQYAQMWAQDAEAMYGYAASSATASQLPALTSAPTTTTDSPATAQQASNAAQAASGSTSVGESLLDELDALLNFGSGSNLASVFSGGGTSALGTFLNGNFLSSTLINGSLAGGPFNPQFILQSLSNFSFLQAREAVAANLGMLQLFDSGPLASSGLSGLGAVGSGASASIGTASRLGAMAVPLNWSAVAQATPISSALGGTPLVPANTAAAGVPGGVAAPMPNAPAALRRRAIPKYGMRLPPVVARPPAAG